ncbi:unnamed protein product [Clonostachys rhizophaga]|uniref:3-beta hydroxysteroid dehydrogenase/isomerase domain-containing protein n=1 Tax=Clonostachys rhizophaga TaxID=160324 RepID=A0A9N9YTK0_9HYPO|nr:unnamed protein product [Clonostachys rhizophaga]
METASYLVIGGCGHQGAHIVRVLLEKYPKAKVAVMSRNPNVNTFPGAQYLKGDVTSSDDLKRVFGVCKPLVVFHTAALIVAFRKKQPDSLIQAVNVDGTLKVIETCKSFGVKALVYTSSASVMHIDQSKPMTDALESGPEVNEDSKTNSYNKSKAEADRIIRAANEDNGLRTCSLRVAAIYGEFDTEQLPGYLNVLKSNQHWMQIGKGENRMSVAYSGNVAHAHILAAEKLLAGAEGVAGEAITISDGSPKFWEHGRAVYRAAGTDVKPNQIIRIPYALIIIVALFEEFLAWAIGRHPTLTRESILFSVNDYTAKNDKARKVLGYNPPVGYEESLERSVKWCLENIEGLKK